MKTFITVVLFTISIGLSAQPPMGGGGGRPQGGPGGGRPPMHGMNNQQEDSFIITELPEITDLTLTQREKLSKAIGDERKDISKLIKEKKELERESQNPGLASKDRVKMMEKVGKVDEKIRKKEEKYDKKYRKILSNDQYLQFKEKKNDIRFRDNNMDKRRPKPGEGSEDMPMRPPGGQGSMEMGEDMF